MSKRSRIDRDSREEFEQGSFVQVLSVGQDGKFQVKRGKIQYEADNMMLLVKFDDESFGSSCVRADVIFKDGYFEK